MKLPTFTKPKASSPEQPDPDANDFRRAVKPTPNLVPQHVREDRGFASTARASALGLVALAGIIGIAFFTSTGFVSSEERKAADAAAEAVSTTAKITNLAPVETYYAGIDERKGEVSTLFEGAIQYSTIYGALFEDLPSGITIESFTTSIGAPCPGGDPFNPSPAIGCATVTATAPDTETISALSTAIAETQDSVLVDPYASEITASGEGLSFRLTANFTADAYSDKFAELAPAPAPGATTEVTTDASAPIVGSDAAATGE